MTLLTEPLAVLLQETEPVRSSLHWIDITGLALLGLFALLGAMRGLWWQVIRLLGLAAAVAVARALAPRLGPDFQVWTELPPPVAHGLVWLLVFLAVLVIASLLGTLGRRTLQAAQLGPVDRFGGMLAGLLTGILLHAAFLVGVSYLGSQVWAAESLREAESRRLLEAVTTRLHLYVGREEAARLRGWLAPGAWPDEEGAPLHPGEEVGEEPRAPYGSQSGLHDGEGAPAAPSGQRVR